MVDSKILESTRRTTGLTKSTGKKLGAEEEGATRKSTLLRERVRGDRLSIFINRGSVVGERYT